MKFEDSKTLNNPNYWKKTLNLDSLPNIKSSKLSGLQTSLRSGVYRVDLEYLVATNNPSDKSEKFVKSVVVKIMGKSKHNLGIDRKSYRSQNPADYAKKPYDILSKRLLAVPQLLDYNPREGFLVLEHLPGPVTDEAFEGPTADIELSLINSRMHTLENIIDKSSVVNIKSVTELEKLQDWKAYIIKGCLANIADVHVYATDSLEDFTDAAGNIRLRRPRISQYGKGRSATNLGKSPCSNEDALDSFKNMHDSFRWIIAREIMNAKMINQEAAQHYKLDHDSTGDLGLFLDSILGRFKSLDDMVVDAGDNYPHHFSRNVIKCAQRKKDIEKTFLLDWDRIMYRKRALGLMQFLCSPVLELDGSEIVKYVKEYQSMTEARVKTLKPARRKKLKPIFENSAEFFKDAMLLGIYEAGFHGPALGCRHEIYHLRSYRKLLKRKKMILPIKLQYSGDGTAKLVNPEFISKKGLSDSNTNVKTNFRYDCYANKFLLGGYRAVATSLYNVVMDHSNFISEQGELAALYDFMKNHKVKGVSVSIFEK
ncbi:MAG: hypothetical protein U9R08_05140 [Nanoarchaeota archaeon]|nr:hypothetical protein [Nanoarchaeota archaeon]